MNQRLEVEISDEHLLGVHKTVQRQRQFVALNLVAGLLIDSLEPAQPMMTQLDAAFLITGIPNPSFHLREAEYKATRGVWEKWKNLADQLFCLNMQVIKTAGERLITPLNLTAEETDFFGVEFMQNIVQSRIEDVGLKLASWWREDSATVAIMLEQKTTQERKDQESQILRDAILIQKERGIPAEVYIVMVRTFRTTAEGIARIFSKPSLDTEIVRRKLLFLSDSIQQINPLLFPTADPSLQKPT